MWRSVKFMLNLIVLIATITIVAVPIGLIGTIGVVIYLDYRRTHPVAKGDDDWVSVPEERDDVTKMTDKELLEAYCHNRPWEKLCKDNPFEDLIPKTPPKVRQQ
jgi:hypothetical protein